MGILIKEEAVMELNFLTEEVNGQKQHFIEGIFLQSEIKNRNGRVYPKNILENEVARYNANYVTKNRAFGELGHPDSPTINLDRVSHMIMSLRPEGNNFIGKAKILDTPNGQIVKKILEGGGVLGVSTRGVGSLKPHNGYQLVQDDFKLATAADIVADPSAPDAFVRGIMEQAEWVMDATGEWQQVDAEMARKQLLEAHRSEIESIALNQFTRFLSKIGK